MSKYCHDDTIHHCLIECEECSAYYDDEEFENSKDHENSIEETIRADERAKVIKLLKEHKEYGMISREEIAINRIIDRIVEQLKEQKNEM